MTISRANWGNIIGFLILIGFLLYGYISYRKRIVNAAYAKGVIVEITKVSKGNRYLDYVFKVDSSEFREGEPLEFCYTCKVGDTVFVRYDKYNPKNSELVHSIPK